MSDPTESVIEAVNQMAQFDPENAKAIEAFIVNLSNMHTEIGNAFNTMAQAWQDEQPLAAEVIELIQNHASAYVGLADMSDETHQTFRTAHAEDLARLEEPRNGEAKWDTVNNQ